MSPTAFAKPGPMVHTLPSGDVFNLYTSAAHVDYLIERLAGVGDLITMGRGKRLTAFSAEALVHRFRTKRGLTPQEEEELHHAEIGLDRYPLLRAVRDVIKKNAEESHSTNEEGRLLLWGACPRPTHLLHEGMSVLLNAHWIQPHLASHPGTYNGMDIRDLVWEWTQACGATHWKTQEAICHRLLNIAPHGAFVALGRPAVDLAMAAVPSDHVLATRFFRCLQRVAAFQWRGHIIWPSAWLRGPGQSELAIKGASGSSGPLTYLLREHVLERVAGHSAGRRAARYTLKVALPSGPFDIKDFGGLAGVHVDDWGVPRKK